MLAHPLSTQNLSTSQFLGKLEGMKVRIGRMQQVLVGIMTHPEEHIALSRCLWEAGKFGDENLAEFESDPCVRHTLEQLEAADEHLEYAKLALDFQDARAAEADLSAALRLASQAYDLIDRYSTLIPRNVPVL